MLSSFLWKYIKKPSTVVVFSHRYRLKKGGIGHVYSSHIGVYYCAERI